MHSKKLSLVLQGSTTTEVPSTFFGQLFLACVLTQLTRKELRQVNCKRHVFKILKRENNYQI